MAPLRIGIDIGGTFTDFVVLSPAYGSLETFKLLSTPHDPAEAVLHGLGRIFAQHGTKEATVIHGSTVATNACSNARARGWRSSRRAGRAA